MITRTKPWNEEYGLVPLTREGLVTLTREAIVPYLVAVSLQARMCNTVIFYILATPHKHNASHSLEMKSAWYLHAFTIPKINSFAFVRFVCK